MSFNHIILSGRLGRDPDLSYTPNGNPVCKMTMAVDKWKVNGEAVPPMWVNMVAWNKTAENMSQWLHKGDKITVGGRLDIRTYENKKYPDVTMYMTEVIVSEFEIDARASRREEPPEHYEPIPEGTPF